MIDRVIALPVHESWNHLWSSQFGHWIATKGLHIVLVVVGAWLATRVIRSVADKISRRLAVESDSGVRSESVKHRQAVASVISSVAVAVLYVVVAVDIVNTLGLPVGSLVAPAAVLGAALGFGAQRIVQDLLSGFFIITEKQYGFGDLVQLTISGSSVDDARSRAARSIPARASILEDGGDGGPRCSVARNTISAILSAYRV